MKINLKDNSYEIIVASNILRKIDINLKQKNCVIICDHNIERLYAPIVTKSLLDQGYNVDIIGFKPGEESKTRAIKAEIEDEMIELEVGRDSFIIALGGGVTGDLAGFIAATYMRGIPFIQIPTSLLAMVDSSIGGKVGIDTPLGKNLIGAFYQPKKVIIDVDVLKTLPKKELANGLAEIIKHAMISEVDYFDFLNKNINKITDKTILIKTIKKSIEIKASVVEEDEKETSLRKVLNYGHTIGHAIEALSHYSISHGDAVAIGMSVEAKISEKILGFKDRNKQNNLLKNAGLKLKVPNFIKTEDIIEKIRLDKKSEDKKPKFTLLKDFGDVAVGQDVSEEIIRQALEEIK